jgi:hypothetical protein
VSASETARGPPAAHFRAAAAGGIIGAPPRGRPMPPPADPTLTRDPDPLATGPPADPAATTGGDGPAATAGPPEAGYDLGDEVGRGAMGVVFRARDRGLDREVAVKLLQDRYPAGSAAAARFLEEARITGRLQHPGIPPVYAVGVWADGRPFLAMKLIRGDTLDDLLRADGPHPTRWLGVFESVCHAVGYAHSRGVIHRDLKPANVMVGAFAEVQVMDWGLAKVLGGPADPGPPGGGEAGPPADADASLTAAGSVLGTPAFMPPEQAEGELHRVGPRADVFGLGAVLCALLTGRPPYDGAAAADVRLAAARGQTAGAFARLDRCGAEPGVVDLCKRCLAADPAARPADGTAVGVELARLRADAADRARELERELAAAAARAVEQRKRRRVQLALAATVLAFLAAAGVGGWLVDRERAARRADELERDAAVAARRGTTERDVTAALNEVAALRRQGEGQADDPDRWGLTLAAARSAQKRAEGLLAAGVPTDDLTRQVGESLAGLDRDERDQKLLAACDRISDEDDVRFLLPTDVLSGRAAVRYREAFGKYGLDLTAVPTADAVNWIRAHRFRHRVTDAVRAWHRGSPLFNTDWEPPPPEEIAKHPPGTFKPPPTVREILDPVLDGVTDDPFAREWWAAERTGDRAAVEALLARPELARMSSRELAALAEGGGGTLARYKGLDAAAKVAALAYDRFPGEFWVHMRLGLGALEKKGKADEAAAVRHMTAAVAARPRSMAARLGLAMVLSGPEADRPEGRRHALAAADLDPASGFPHMILSFMCFAQDDWAGGVAAVREMIRRDPDVGFFMAAVSLNLAVPGAAGPDRAEGDALIDALVADYPDRPEPYAMRANRCARRGDARGELNDLRRALALNHKPGPQRYVLRVRLGELEQLARWETRLPAVLRGDDRPATREDWTGLAEYSATFDRALVRAVGFTAEALELGPPATPYALVGPAGWAVRAAAGAGSDAASLSPGEKTGLRRRALAWLRAAEAKGVPARQLAGGRAEFAPVRTPAGLAALPPDERAEWEAFWAGGRGLPVAPPPRPVAR